MYLFQHLIEPESIEDIKNSRNFLILLNTSSSVSHLICDGSKESRQRPLPTDREAPRVDKCTSPPPLSKWKALGQFWQTPLFSDNSGLEVATALSMCYRNLLTCGNNISFCILYRISLHFVVTIRLQTVVHYIRIMVVLFVSKTFINYFFISKRSQYYLGTLIEIDLKIPLTSELTTSKITNENSSKEVFYDTSLIVPPSSPSR